MKMVTRKVIIKYIKYFDRKDIFILVLYKGIFVGILQNFKSNTIKRIETPLFALRANRARPEATIFLSGNTLCKRSVALFPRRGNKGHCDLCAPRRIFDTFLHPLLLAA